VASLVEGSVFPFIVWTDHKNLSYIQTAKRLNSQQSRWAFIFGRFNFTLTYRPGTKNTKPDSFSRQFTANNTGSEPKAIMPSTCIHRCLLGDPVPY
jgi:phage gp37-like protein